MRLIHGRLRLAVCLLLAPVTASAHSFGKLYTLPVPVWLYLYGAAAALVVSFLVIGYFVGTPAEAHRNFKTYELPAAVNRLRAPLPRRALSVIAVALLALCIASGLVGTRNPYANINMTLFWIVFVLAYAYGVALFGDSYGALNPWRALTGFIGRFVPQAFAGRWRYPERWGYYPALALYLAFVWIELFGNTRPFSLSLILLGYTAVNLLGAWAWGTQAWFRYGEFFTLFFRIVGKCAPVEFADGRFRLRQPFVGLLQERCESFSLLLFILFMLSSTAFDGLHETVWWVRVFWQELAPLLKPLVGDDIVQTFPLLKKLYAIFQSLALILSPLAYFAVYATLLEVARRLTRSERSLRDLCLQFGYSLVPIALVYHVTHYYTLAVSQGVTVFRLASDPFGFGWDLFGTAGWFLNPVMLDAGTIWHTQVALILIGHIISVYLAHLVALRIFPSPRAALLSQLPMLLLMVLYTTAGLWILSLPIQSGVYMPAGR